VSVTVLLAVHNGGAYLREAVASVLGQTYRDFELLVVDDASTDGSPELVESFGDPRVRVLRLERNVGQVPALNLGLREARGEIVVRQDADDVFRPRLIEVLLGALEREPQVGLVGSWTDLIDTRGNALGRIEGAIRDRPEYVYWTLRQYVLIAHSGAAYRRDPVLELGGYDETMGPAEDKDLWRRLLLAGWDARIVPEALLAYRVHGEQLSQVDRDRQRRNDDRSQEALLERLAPGAPARFLRLLLAGDPAAWSEPVASAGDALDALLAGTRTALGLDAGEADRLRGLLAARVADVAFSGWRAPATSRWRTAGAGAVAWAAPGRARAFGRLAAAAPAVRSAHRVVAPATVRVTRLPALAVLRGRLRRHPSLRRLYARVVRH
jgi:GT2 family glycosyltransferase